MKTALTIAGSDCSGGAGIQADIKTMTMNAVYAMSAITSLTTQNTTGVSDILNLPPEFIAEELDMIFTDINPDSVKIGMVSTAEIIDVVVSKLKQYNAKNIVVDPVMVSTSGSKLLHEDAMFILKKNLLPLADIITPNIAEAEILTGNSIRSAEDMEKAAGDLYKKYGRAVLLKGGHSLNDANDLLIHDEKLKWISGQRINNPNTHGTGCTLSSAIAANLAKEFTIYESVVRAKEYISCALKAMLNLGNGSGPLMHTFNLEGYFSKTKGD